MVVLMVEDVSSRDQLMALLSTLLVDQVVVDIVGRMLMFFFPVRFLFYGISFT